MPIKEYLENARDKFTDAMSAAERFSIGLNDRAKRLKQAMFPQDPEPGEPMPPRDKPAAQDDLERANLKKEYRQRR